MLVAFVLCMFVWVYWYNLSTDLTGMTQQEYINDSYFILTDDLTEGVEIDQPLSTDKTMHGATFVFHTYAKAVNGTVLIEVYDRSNHLLTTGTLDMALLHNNIHHTIMFDSPIVSNEMTDYRFVISAIPATDEDRIALWRSDQSVDLPTLTQGGEVTDTTLGFGIVTHRGDNSTMVLMAILAVLSCIVAVGGYLIIFVFKMPLWATTAILVFSLGIIYNLVFPPRAAPDEEVHIHTAYFYSNRLLGVEGETLMTMRADDTQELRSAADLSIFNYQQVMQELFRPTNDATLVPYDIERLSIAEPFYLYIPTILGITLGRLLGVNYITLIFLGRIFNLAAFATLMSTAVALMPKYKQIMMAVALLPSCLHLASSFSYDSTVIASSAVFIAYCLFLAKKETPILKRQIAGLAAVGFLLAPMKAIYLFIIGFCRIIPTNRFKTKIGYYLALFSVLGSAAFAWLRQVPTIMVFATTWDDVESAPPPLVSYVETEFYDFWYILGHIQDTIKLFIASLQENLPLYLSQMVGGEMGEPILSELTIWQPIVFVLFTLLFLSTAMRQDETPLLNGFQKAISVICMLCVCAALSYVMISWTPRRYDTIWGMQGRYLIPMLPLLLLTVQNGVLYIKKDITKPIILGMVCCSIAAAVNVFQGVVGVLG